MNTFEVISRNPQIITIKEDKQDYNGSIIKNQSTILYGFEILEENDNIENIIINKDTYLIITKLHKYIAPIKNSCNIGDYNSCTISYSNGNINIKGISGRTGYNSDFYEYDINIQYNLLKNIYTYNYIQNKRYAPNSGYCGGGEQIFGSYDGVIYKHNSNNHSVERIAKDNQNNLWDIRCGPYNFNQKTIILTNSSKTLKEEYDELSKKNIKYETCIKTLEDIKLKYEKENEELKKRIDFLEHDC